jgi:hypothetical protein
MIAAAAIAAGCDTASPATRTTSRSASCADADSLATLAQADVSLRRLDRAYGEGILGMPDYARRLDHERRALEDAGCETSAAYVQALSKLAWIHRAAAVEGIIAGIPTAIHEDNGPYDAAAHLEKARDLYVLAQETIWGMPRGAVPVETRFSVLHGLGHTEELLGNYAAARDLQLKARAVLPPGHRYKGLVRSRLENLEQLMSE